VGWAQVQGGNGYGHGDSGDGAPRSWAGARGRSRIRGARTPLEPLVTVDMGPVQLRRPRGEKSATVGELPMLRGGLQHVPTPPLRSKTKATSPVYPGPKHWQQQQQLQKPMAQEFHGGPNVSSATRQGEKPPSPRESRVYRPPPSPSRTRSESETPLSSTNSSLNSSYKPTYTVHANNFDLFCTVHNLPATPGMIQELLDLPLHQFFQMWFVVLVEKFPQDWKPYGEMLLECSERLADEGYGCAAHLLQDLDCNDFAEDLSRYGLTKKFFRNDVVRFLQDIRAARFACASTSPASQPYTHQHHQHHHHHQAQQTQQRYSGSLRMPQTFSSHDQFHTAQMDAEFGQGQSNQANVPRQFHQQDFSPHRKREVRFAEANTGGQCSGNQFWVNEHETHLFAQERNLTSENQEMMGEIGSRKPLPKSYSSASVLPSMHTTAACFNPQELVSPREHSPKHATSRCSLSPTGSAVNSERKFSFPPNQNLKFREVVSDGSPANLPKEVSSFRIPSNTRSFNRSTFME